MTTARVLLRRGGHVAPSDGLCLMEYVSVLAGQGFSDHPRCTHPALAALARRINDEVSDRARPWLVGLAPALRGTNTSCPVAAQAVVIACARAGLALAPDDRVLGRVVILAAAEHLRLTADRTAPCCGGTSTVSRLLDRVRRRRTAYRTEMAIIDAVNRIVAATGGLGADAAACAHRDAVLVELLADAIEAHRGHHATLGPVLEPVAVA